LRLIGIINAVTDVGDEFRQSSFYHSQTGQELRGTQGQTRTRSSSSEEDSFKDVICLQSSETLLNSESNSGSPEGRTSSGLNFNMETLPNNSYSSIGEPHYLHMSIRTSQLAVDDYVLE
jgi:hypothetical protein